MEKELFEGELTDEEKDEMRPYVQLYLVYVMNPIYFQAYSKKKTPISATQAYGCQGRRETGPEARRKDGSK